MPDTTQWQIALRAAQEPVKAVLRASNFKKHGNHFNRPGSDGLVQVIGFQSGSYVSSLHGQFTVNLGVYVPSIAELENNHARGRYVTDAHCQIRQRLGSVADLGDDKWWPLDETAHSTGVSLADALTKHGIPFVDRYRSAADIVQRFEIDGKLPSSNPGRSALVVAVICHTAGDNDRARHYFDNAKRLAGTHAGFLKHVGELQLKCDI